MITYTNCDENFQYSDFTDMITKIISSVNSYQGIEIEADEVRAISKALLKFLPLLKTVTKSN